MKSEERGPALVFAPAALASAEQVLLRSQQAVNLQAVDFADWHMPEAFVRQGAGPGAFEGFSAR